MESFPSLEFLGNINEVISGKSIKYIRAYVTNSNKKITSAICDKNILGVQFHPKRSGKYGL